MWQDPTIEGRWDQGMATERYQPWHAAHLCEEPIHNVEGVAGGVAVISLHGEEGGVTYEQTEPLGAGHFRPKSSPAIPNLVRYE